MEEHKDGIFFTVNETLYFEVGQEIEEMMAISLDPDITLQMYEQYTQIRGLIILQGEYKKTADKADYVKPYTEKSVFIEKVIDKNKQDAKFSHRFPLDISIPNDRVENMENVQVLVDAFDYELPDVQTLKIEAKIHIQGVKAEATKEVAKEEIKADKVTAMETEEKQPLQEEVKEVIQLVETEPEKIESKEMDQEKTEETKTVLAKSTEKPTEDKQEIDIQLSETETVEEEQEVKDVQFLTDLFGGDQEETKTMIKMYIIQEEDTIESIAKKYDIPTLELIKDNQLSEESITEGQLIKIPYVGK